MTDPQHFLDLAKELVRQPTPARIRTVIGRGYYAAFLSAEEKLSVDFVLSSEPECHSEVSTALINSNDPEVKVLARKLNDLRAWRTTADYELKSSQIEKVDVGLDAIDDAEFVIGQLSSLLSGSAGDLRLEQMVDAARQSSKPSAPSSLIFRVAISSILPNLQ